MGKYKMIPLPLLKYVNQIYTDDNLPNSELNGNYPMHVYDIFHNTDRN